MGQMSVIEVGFYSLPVLGLVALAVFKFYKRHKERTDHRQFEVDVLEYARSIGYTDLKLGKGVSDDGIDGSGKLDGRFYIFQAKCYKSAKITIHTVKELVGTCTQHKAVPVLAILKQTKITKPAQQYINAMRIIVWRM